MSPHSTRPPQTPPGRLNARRMGFAWALVAAAAFFFLESPRIGPPETSSESTPPKRNRADAGAAAYAGSASCRECHAAEFKLWTDSHHALAERTWVAARDRPAFDPPRAIRHGTQTSEVDLVARALHEPAIIAIDANGQRRAIPVERVIGVEPLRQFLVAAPGGRFQVTELAFDPTRREWFDIFGNEDRRPGEWGHWTGRGMTWNAMCATCHNTRLQKNYHAATDAYATTMAESGVGCEACHGPLAAHAGWQRERRASNPGRAAERVGERLPGPTHGLANSLARPASSAATVPKDPTVHAFSRDQMLDTCGACHARRAELTGDFTPGERFLDHYAPVIPDETAVFYADGQVHAEDYEYTSFLGSRMYGAGVRCVDCHEPHSGQTRAPGNALCLRCHQGQMPAAPKIDPVAHSHHDSAKPGGRCVDCHMPQTVYMQRHARHDHGFTIPDPWLTQQLAVPNACNRCHTGRDAAWALVAVEKWYGSRMERPTRARARAIARARAGQNAAADPLLQILREEKNPLWRAVAVGLLKRWSAEPKVKTALLERLGDSSALVRMMMARSLEPWMARADTAAQDACRRLLVDPVRAVRIEAAWVSRTSLDTGSVAGMDLRRFLEANLDEPNGAMQQGVFDLDRGDTEAAFARFRQAVEWDPASAPLRQALAVVLSLKGDPTGAVRELETACRLAPRDAECRFKLGLALNEAGQRRDAVDALEQTVKLDPQFAQAWYNLGLARSALQQPDPALEALVRAESIDSNSPQIPYARATILARLGRVNEARAAARRALEVQPGFAEAVNLLRILDHGAPGGN